VLKRPYEFGMRVTRCFVHFMQAIDPAVSGLRAERTSLISLGDDECRFAVLETDDPLAKCSDALDQRFAQASDR
jgi:hypothetical protein